MAGAAPAPPAWKAGILAVIRHRLMVEASGVEPLIAEVSARNSNHLSYASM